MPTMVGTPGTCSAIGGGALGTFCSSRPSVTSAPATHLLDRLSHCSEPESPRLLGWCCADWGCTPGTNSFSVVVTVLFI